MTEEFSSQSCTKDCRSETNKPSEDQSLSSKSFCYDKVMEHLGPLGKFQLRAFVLLGLPLIFPGIVTMSYTFIGALPAHRCFVEHCDEEGTIEFSPPWLNNTVPTEYHGISSCVLFNDTRTSKTDCWNSNNTRETVHCNKWVFDNSIHETTIASEFELVCADEWKLSLANSIFMFGTLVGAATLGHLADTVGRKLAFTGTVFMLGCGSLGLAFSTNYYVFCVLRFLCGLFTVGLFDISFVWGIESVGKKYKIICGLIYQIIFSVGACLLGLAAYFIRNWRTLQIAISALMLPFTLIYWAVPESIRWLATKNECLKVRQLIEKAEKTNRKTVPYYLLPETPDVSLRKTSHLEPEKSKETLVDIFNSSTLVKRLLIIFVAWIAAVMGYYGLAFSSSNLSPNFYLNYELTMAIDIPAYLSEIVIIKKLGQKVTVVSSLIASGIACLVVGILAEESVELRISFFLAGKFFMACLFGSLYSYTMDLFPTSVRSAVVGMCSTWGRIGGILSPIILDRSKSFYPSLPYILFAGANIIVAVLCLFLPETGNRPLPSNITEAVSIKRSKI